MPRIGGQTLILYQIKVINSSLMPVSGVKVIWPITITRSRKHYDAETNSYGMASCTGYMSPLDIEVTVNAAGYSNGVQIVGVTACDALQGLMMDQYTEINVGSYVGNQTYSVTISTPSNGSVRLGTSSTSIPSSTSLSGVAPGTTVYVRVIPNSGYRCSFWSATNVATSSVDIGGNAYNNGYFIVGNNSVSVSANFVANTVVNYTVTVNNVQGYGTVYFNTSEPVGTLNVNTFTAPAGTRVYFKCVPDTDYALAFHWGTTGFDDSSPTGQFTMPGSNTQLYVKWIDGWYTVSSGDLVGYRRFDDLENDDMAGSLDSILVYETITIGSGYSGKLTMVSYTEENYDFMFLLDRGETPNYMYDGGISDFMECNDVYGGYAIVSGENNSKTITNLPAGTYCIGYSRDTSVGCDGGSWVAYKLELQKSWYQNGSYRCYDDTNQGATIVYDTFTINPGYIGSISMYSNTEYLYDGIYLARPNTTGRDIVNWKGSFLNATGSGNNDIPFYNRNSYATGRMGVRHVGGLLPGTYYVVYRRDSNKTIRTNSVRYIVISSELSSNWYIEPYHNYDTFIGGTSNYQRVSMTQGTCVMSDAHPSPPQQNGGGTTIVQLCVQNGILGLYPNDYRSLLSSGSSISNYSFVNVNQYIYDFGRRDINCQTYITASGTGATSYVSRVFALHSIGNADWLYGGYGTDAIAVLGTNGSGTATGIYGVSKVADNTWAQLISDTKGYAAYHRYYSITLTPYNLNSYNIQPYVYFTAYKGVTYDFNVHTVSSIDYNGVFISKTPLSSSYIGASIGDLSDQPGRLFFQSGVDEGSSFEYTPTTTETIYIYYIMSTYPDAGFYYHEEEEWYEYFVDDPDGLDWNGIHYGWWEQDYEMVPYYDAGESADVDVYSNDSGEIGQYYINNTAGNSGFIIDGVSYEQASRATLRTYLELAQGKLIPNKVYSEDGQMVANSFTSSGLTYIPRQLYNAGDILDKTFTISSWRHASWYDNVVNGVTYRQFDFGNDDSPVFDYETINIPQNYTATIYLTSYHTEDDPEPYDGIYISMTRPNDWDEDYFDDYYISLNNNLCSGTQSKTITISQPGTYYIVCRRDESDLDIAHTDAYVRYRAVILGSPVTLYIRRRQVYDGSYETITRNARYGDDLMSYLDDDYFVDYITVGATRYHFTGWARSNHNNWSQIGSTVDLENDTVELGSTDFIALYEETALTWYNETVSGVAYRRFDGYEGATSINLYDSSNVITIPTGYHKSITLVAGSTENDYDGIYLTSEAGQGAWFGQMNSNTSKYASVTSSSPSGRTKAWATGNETYTFEVPSGTYYTVYHRDNTVRGSGNWVRYTVGGNIANTYTVTFNANGGTLTGDNFVSGESSHSVIVTYDQGNYNQMGTAERSGYVFAGWWTTQNGGVQLYNSSGSCVNETGYWVNNGWHYTGNVTVYAHWTPNYVAIPTSLSTNSNLNNYSADATFTYNGNSKAGISGYDDTKMSIVSGSTTGTNAGSYSVTFRIGDDYMWSDGTTTDKTVTWYIGKAGSTAPTFNPTAKSANYARPSTSDSQTVTITAASMATGSVGSISYTLNSVKKSGSNTDIKGQGWSLSGTTLTYPRNATYGNPGAYTISVTATTAGDSNHMGASTSAKEFTLTINDWMVSLSLELNPSTINYGDSLSPKPNATSNYYCVVLTRAYAGNETVTASASLTSSDSTVGKIITS